ncbi:MAG: ATP-grasp domain-containing protein [Abitibacteriaceae bacterium]|nr:ATP-grasp domain-containing protein [Abditibacteriaceae bacterium]MBV9867555.1 ATP-grasp domain-containing protein [Abditibacteriaceae bacterium]
MKLIFCSDPLTPRKPDADYAREVAAVESLGLSYAVIDYEALVNAQDAAQAVRRVREEAELTSGIYRGWMLRPTQYSELFNALMGRGIQLINSPAAYQHCHYLPEWYPALQAWTAQSVWLPYSGDVNHIPFDEIMQHLEVFGAAPIIVKDYVKSRKHEWAEACFIPSAADRAAVERVVRRFVELQDESLNEGLVFREFIEFEPLTTHSKSGMPLIQEHRIFFWHHQPIFVAEYWEEGNYSVDALPLDQFCNAAQAVQSDFFTMDVAKRRDGNWSIIELGDAQVAGLPLHADVSGFYEALINHKFVSNTDENKYQSSQ